MRNFKVEDFEGSGQYLVRTTKDFVESTSFLATIMYKVGYIKNNLNIGSGGQITTLTSVTDGWTRVFNYGKNEDGSTNFDDITIWQSHDIDGPSTMSKQKLCDHLNNPSTQEMRFATQEEVVRAIIHVSKYRAK